jgi:hypothetical protein
MDVCCTSLKFRSRRHYPNVAEAEQPDAIIEFHPDKSAWLLWIPSVGEYCHHINYCPWCGTELSTLRP